MYSPQVSVWLNKVSDGLAKMGSLQPNGIFVHESWPSFVYEKYLRDVCQVGTFRECPVTNYVLF